MRKKEVYTATHKKAQYTGTHPYIKDKIGMYYWNNDQQAFIFRPDVNPGEPKSDWYRVNKENIIELE